MISDAEIEELEERADKAASARSDDFGHSVIACMEFQAGEAEYLGGVAIPQLLLRLHSAENALRASGCELTQTEIPGGGGVIFTSGHSSSCSKCAHFSEVERLGKGEK